MELIYVWIEKFRNIKECEFSLSKDFTVEVIHDSVKMIENDEINIKIINIHKREESYSVFDKNIRNVTAVVGKNCTGKSNFLTCIGDLLTSFCDSSFILIYFDKIENKYLIECNQIGIKVNNKVMYAIQNEYQPKTTIYSLVNEQISEYSNDGSLIYDIEYITVKDDINKLIYPNANCFYSYIGRFGLSYDNYGLLYKFKYLNDINHTENFENNNITISIEIPNVIEEKFEYRIHILPEYFPGKKYVFDANKEGDREIYKKVFMLRFLEKIINSMGSSFEDINIKECTELSNMIKQCDENMDKILSKYEEIKQKIIQIRSISMKHRRENDIDLELCYKYFLNKLENTIVKIDEQNFENSFKCNINISSILSNKDLMNSIEKLLQISDEHDVCLEFMKKSLRISFNGLSDGLGYLTNLYSSIHKCLKQNKVEKFKNVILILDEPDIHMHPEWSRGLLSNIFEFLNNQFPQTMFQIILSTHSPFVLSDIPMDNIILLEKDKNGLIMVNKNILNTFGANIHTLLKSSFFMDSTIGEFARTKINKVINFINSKEGLTEGEALEIINLIGEPIIKDKLLRMYYDEFPHKYEDPISIYKRKLEKLEAVIVNDAKINKQELLTLEKKLDQTLNLVRKLKLESVHDD